MIDTTSTFLTSHNEISLSIIQKLLPVKAVDHHIFENLPKICPYAEKIQQQRKELGGELLFDKLASKLGLTSITQRHFPYLNKEDIKKLYNNLWPSSFSDHECTVVGHLLTLYLLLSLPEEHLDFDIYSQYHKIPSSLQYLIKAYRFFDIGLYDEFLRDLTFFVGFQLNSIKETSRLDSDTCQAIFNHLLIHEEYKSAFFFVKSFNLNYDASDTLKLLFHYDFRSCLGYARTHPECLPTFIEMCVLPENDSLARQLLETSFTKEEIVLMSQHAYGHLHNTRLANFIFLLFYVNHEYTLAIAFHSLLSADRLLHQRQQLVDTMRLKLTHEEFQMLHQFQVDASFLPLLNQISPKGASLASLTSLSPIESKINSPPSSPVTSPTQSSHETFPPLVFRSKPVVQAPPSKYQRVDPEPPIIKEKKVRSMQRRLRRNKRRTKKGGENAMDIEIDTDTPKASYSLLNEPSSKEKSQDDEDEEEATPLSTSRYLLRMRKQSKEEADH